MRRLHSALSLTLAVLVPAALMQACEDDPSSGGFGFDAGPSPSFDASRADAIPHESGVDSGMLDATDDAAEDASVDSGPRPLNDGSAPVELLRLLKYPRSLAVDGSFLYVATADGIMRLAKDGGAIARVSAADDVNRLTRDGARLFYTTDDAVKVVPTNANDGGGGATILALDAGPLPVRFSAGTVYVGLYGSSFGTQLLAVLEDGGSARIAASGVRPYDFAVVGSTIFAPSTGTSDQDIYALPGDGGTGPSRAVAFGLVSDLVERDGYVYWSTRGGTVMRIPVASGAAETIATGEGPVAGIAVDDANVYWVRYEQVNGLGVVRRAPKTGGAAPVTLASAQQSAFSIVVDDAYVYWAALEVDAGVARVPK